MGKLLDQVLRIHESRMNADISEYNINKEIEAINKKILDSADKGKTEIYINIECINDSLATAVSCTSNRYDYYVNELSSAKYIKEKINEYYKNEGFTVHINGSNTIRIDWNNALIDNNK